MLFSRLSSSFIPHFCLFISGAAGLVYELVWIRQIKLVFGGTLYAISAVLCAFMAGLALGAWGISRYLHRPPRDGVFHNPIRLYAILEGAIGIYALMFPWSLDLLARATALFIDPSQGSTPLLHFVEFGLCALLMLPATFMMGATLPLIGCWAIGRRADRVFPGVAALYGLNTIGAACGVLFAQFFGIGVLGVSGVTWVAVGLNGLVFLLCYFFPGPAAETTPDYARPAEEGSAESEDPPPAHGLSILLLVLFTYSGLVSLASEILWTRVLVFPLGSTLYSFALILAAFLLGIALGSLMAERLLGNSRWILKFLVIEGIIGVYCIAVIPVFDFLPQWTAQADRLFYDLENTPLRTLWIRSLFAFGLMLIPTLGFGLLFPLANRIHLAWFGTVGRTLGNSYSLNTLGGVAGTILTPFVLIPLWGIRGSLFALYALLLLMTFLAIARHRRWRPARIAAALPVLGVLFYGGFAWSNPRIATDRLGKQNFGRLEIDAEPDRLRLLDYKEGGFATLSVVEDRTTGARTLYVDGFSTATVSGSVGGSAYMQAMGFIPMALHPDPKRALVICFGTGNTMGTVAQFPGVRVDGVEIDRNVLSLSHWFSAWNGDILQRPNARMVVQDGRSFIRWSRGTYDVITLEPMSPVQAGVNNLYSREFYELSARRLNPGGIMMQWLPLHLVGPRDAWEIIKTFQDVFPHTSVWNSFLTRIVLLVGSMEPVSLDKKRFDRLGEDSAVRRMGEQIGIRSFLDFEDFFLTGGAPLQRFLKDVSPITDDRPILEYSSTALLPPLKWQTDETFVNLLRHRADSFPPVRNLREGEVRALRQGLALRTAQRFSVFSQRYDGPGKAFFAEKNYQAGLSEMKSWLDKHPNDLIRLRPGKWAPEDS